MELELLVLDKVVAAEAQQQLDPEPLKVQAGKKGRKTLL